MKPSKEEEFTARQMGFSGINWVRRNNEPGSKHTKTRIRVWAKNLRLLHKTDHKSYLYISSFLKIPLSFNHLNTVAHLSSNNRLSSILSGVCTRYRNKFELLLSSNNLREEIIVFPPRNSIRNSIILGRKAKERNDWQRKICGREDRWQRKQFGYIRIIFSTSPSVSRSLSRPR